jgi:hypothetical protein
VSAGDPKPFDDPREHGPVRPSVSLAELEAKADRLAQGDLDALKTATREDFSRALKDEDLAATRRLFWGLGAGIPAFFIAFSAAVDRPVLAQADGWVLGQIVFAVIGAGGWLSRPARRDLARQRLEELERGEASGESGSAEHLTQQATTDVLVQAWTGQMIMAVGLVPLFLVLTGKTPVLSQGGLSAALALAGGAYALFRRPSREAVLDRVESFRR